MAEIFATTAGGSRNEPINPDLSRARDGDAAAFDRLIGPLRGELHAHCYRMLGSSHDADDALQEALVRAWKAISRFEGRGSLRSWLYTAATRTCLDSITARGRRALPVDLGPASDRTVVNDTFRTDIAWLGPYAGTGESALSAQSAGPSGSDDPTNPATTYERREAVELAFVAALQYLPGNQRAALLLFDVLGYSAAEIATMMDTSVASVNSALQRARRILADRLPSRSQQQTLREMGDDAVRRIVTSFSTAFERGDTDALIALLTKDVTWSMPPMPHWYQGIDSATDFARQVPMGSCGSWRIRHLTANGQPAVACYLRPDETAATFDAWSINVLTLHGDQITEITTFIGTDHFPVFDLPLSLPA